MKKEKQKSNSISAILTAEEYAIIKKIATDSGLTISKVIKALIRANENKVIRSNTIIE
jgi:hypothetical protein